ncbi:MAG: cation diffusion facilitator family transporter [Thermoleophilaceae bacterium]
MVVALAINVALLAIGVAGWLAFDSVALLADAGHVLSDVAAIALGVFAATVAARPPTAKRTFGYHRTEILAALANGVLLVAVAVVVFVEAIGRLNGSPDVGAGGVLVVGLIGLAGNVAATAALAGGEREDINLEGVLRHSAADALGSLGVIVAGAVVLATGWEQADAIAGMLIGLLVLLGSWRLISEPLNVLMEGAPPGVNVNDVGEAMARVDGVREVHDLHVWTVTSGFPALAAHVIVEATHDPDIVRGQVEALLNERFGIEHTTLQVMAERLLKLEDRLPGNR